MPTYVVPEDNFDWLDKELTRLSKMVSSLGYALSWSTHKEGQHYRYFIHNSIPAYNSQIVVGLLEDFAGLPKRVLMVPDVLATTPETCVSCLEKLSGFCVLLNPKFPFAITALCESCVKSVYTTTGQRNFLTYVGVLLHAYEAARCASPRPGYVLTRAALVTLGKLVGIVEPSFPEDFVTFVKRYEPQQPDALFLRLKDLIVNKAPQIEATQLPILEKAVSLYKEGLAAAILSLENELPPEQKGLGKWYDNAEDRVLDTEIVGLKQFQSNSGLRYLYFAREKVSGYDFKFFCGKHAGEVGSQLKIKARIKHKMFKGSWETHLTCPQFI